MKNLVTVNHPALVNALFLNVSWQYKWLITIIATAILAISANISIPTQPVPFTFQSLAVLLIGATLGRKLATYAVLQYLLAGFIGLPVFANGTSGLATLMLSPSVGYLFGFIFSAYLAGFAAEKGFDRKFITGLIAFALAHQLIFVFGVIYLKYFLNVSMLKAIQLGYLPFVGFDFIKFVLAAFTMSLLWRAHKRNANNA